MQSVRPCFPNYNPVSSRSSILVKFPLNTHLHLSVLKYLEKSGFKCFAGAVSMPNVYTVFKCSYNSGLKRFFSKPFATQLDSG